jgi:hypothetical protein
MQKTNDKVNELVTIEIQLNAEQIRLINWVIDQMKLSSNVDTNQSELIGKAISHYLRYLGINMMLNGNNML